MIFRWVEEGSSCIFRGIDILHGGVTYLLLCIITYIVLVQLNERMNF